MTAGPLMFFAAALATRAVAFAGMLLLRGLW